MYAPTCIFCADLTTFLAMVDQVAEVLFMPLQLIFKYTCPPCEYGGPWENWCGNQLTLRAADLFS